MSEDDPKRNGFHKVLVLNSSYGPINITSWRRAMILMYKGKASGVKFNGTLINGKLRLPEIIKLTKYVPIPYLEIVLTRKNIYLRDNHTCQYCGKNNGSLTLDHIIPKSRGGRETWDNMVVSCARCNNRKGDQTLEAAGMKLTGTPYRPPSSLYLHMTRLTNVPNSWTDYFFNKRHGSTSSNLQLTTNNNK
ncbi:MAG: HNH endonuclease [Candidatus Margulisbacteria bacterium]|nr:HNH endonuclease [Candidatus Margulisiibacteriota bacterium]